MMNYILKKLSKHKLPNLFLFMHLFALATVAQVKISGKVTDVKGNGIGGVSVTVKNTNSGTSTNTDGSFVLSVILKPGKSTVVFSTVGYKSAEASLNITSISDYTATVQLSADALGMDEAVVVGSSLSQSRKQLGNTVNSVSGKVLTKSGTGNLTAALQGKIPGAQITQTSGDPAGGISVRMRGTSSIVGSAEPLYVIDGVVASNATNNVTNLNVLPGKSSQIGNNRMVDINPNDIEKIDVIPGASASAIYGSRASNGVVLITTKKGKAGQVKIDFSTSLMSNSLRKRVYISKYGKMFGVAKTPNGFGYALGNISNAPTGYTGALSVPYTRPTDGILRTFATDLVDVTRYDYQDYIFRKGYGTDNYISLSGGSDNTKYYFSSGYFKNEGILVGSDYRRFNFKTRIEQNINQYITVLGGVAFTNSFSNEKPNGNVFWSPINAMNINNNIFNLEERDAKGFYKSADDNRVNPLNTIYDNKITQQVNRTISDFQIKIRPVKGLAIDYILGVDNIAQEGNNLIKRLPYLNSSGTYSTFEGTGYTGNATVNSLFINNDLNFTYNTNVNKFSSLTALGISENTQKIIGSSVAGRDLGTAVFTIDGAAQVEQPRNYVDKRIIYGAFLQQTFGYNNLVFVTLAGRIDGSTAFPKDKRNFFYPKLSSSVSVSDFEFWKNSKVKNVINSFRVRASLGQAGNLSGIGSYDQYNSYSSSSLNGVTAYNINGVSGNPNVAPERHSEFEIGSDLGFFDNKLTVNFTAYSKKIINNSLLVERVVAPSSGEATKIENVGNLTNKGWELGININPIVKKDFSVNIFGSVNRNKNLVTATSQFSPITFGAASGAPSVILANQPVGVFYGNYFVRDANGNIALDARGLTIPATEGTGSQKKPALKVIGNPNPGWIVSFGSNIDYKKFSLGFLFDGALGQDVFNADRRTRQGVGIGELSEKELKGEVPRGYIFSLYTTEEWRIEKGTYIKLRELSLTYQIPSIAKFVKSSAVSLTGRNLLSFDTYQGYDPETNAGGNSTVLRGIDFGNIPNPRTVQLTLRAQF
jgi:TonB-linked SusC/RagA family outer membrane protein